MKSITIKKINYLEIKANMYGEIKCPFCKKIHKHNGVNGHRVAPCTSLFIINPIFFKEKWHFKRDGYYIKFD